MRLFKLPKRFSNLRNPASFGTLALCSLAISLGLVGRSGVDQLAGRSLPKPVGALAMSRHYVPVQFGTSVGSVA